MKLQSRCPPLRLSTGASPALCEVRWQPAINSTPPSFASWLSDRAVNILAALNQILATDGCPTSAGIFTITSHRKKKGAGLLCKA